MGIRHSILGVASIVLLVICSVLFVKIENDENSKEVGIASQVGFDVAGEGKYYRIAVNKNGNDNLYYAFLPSYAELSKIKLSINGDAKVKIAETELKSGEYLENFETNQEYSIVLYTSKNKIVEQGKIQFLVSANLPAVFIITKSGNMDYINSEKGNKEKGFIIITSEEGKELYSDKLDKLSGRGNTSWDAIKKSYSIETHSKADLLGMKDAKKWILIANYYDGTFCWAGEGEFFVKVLDEKNLPGCKLLRGLYYTKNHSDVGKYYPVWSNFEQMLWLSIIILNFISVFVRKDISTNVLMLGIIGLSLFELLFEARARYLYIYVPLYIILAIYGISFINQKISTKKISSKDSAV